ncbi:MAG: AAA family ATPase [Sulfurimonas sp.]|nr:AAA family ATPase [Sulfurimonas sp.]
MIIAYISNRDKECFTELKNEFTEIKNFNAIEEFINFYARSKNRDVVLIYRVSELSDIQALSNIHFGKNVYMIVIGKNSVEHSLLAGKIGVDSYVSEMDANIGVVRELIFHSQSIIKKRRGKSNISVFTGISGGVGTTTITMNLAKNIAQNNPEKNVLFLDFAYTKSISNLFFNRIQPEKNIINITTIQNLSVEELLENGLYKLSDNLYFVPGIQKHTEREELEKQENIQKVLNFINFTKEYFDIVLIDAGIFEDVELEIDIQEIADNLFIVTEFSIPSMSILKTYIDIIDKSGWYNKAHIIANRSDSFGSVSEEQAYEILSKGLKHNFKIDFSLPNDALHLRECWRDARLVHDVYPDSPFMKSLTMMGDKFFINKENPLVIVKQPKETLLSKVRKWL